MHRVPSLSLFRKRFRDPLLPLLTEACDCSWSADGSDVATDASTSASQTSGNRVSTWDRCLHGMTSAWPGSTCPPDGRGPQLLRGIDHVALKAVSVENDDASVVGLDVALTGKGPQDRAGCIA